MLQFVALVAVLAVDYISELPISQRHNQALGRYMQSKASTPVHDKVVKLCKKYHAEDKVDEVEPGVYEFQKCFYTVMDFEQIALELQQAIPYGTQEIKEVTRKFCARTPEIKTCLHILNSKLSPCMPKELKDNVTRLNTVMDATIDFACDDGGDRIARFFGEGGLHCAIMQAEPLTACQVEIEAAANQTLSDEDECTVYDDFVSCVERPLDECYITTAKEIATPGLAIIREKYLACNQTNNMD